MLDRALLRHGVFVLARERRRDLAERLAALGADPFDVDGIAGLVFEGAPEVMARRYLAGLLAASEDRLRAAIADMREWRESRPASPPAESQAPRYTHPGERDRAVTAQRLAAERREWPDDDRLSLARAMAADGRGAKAIAAETGLGESQAAEIVAERRPRLSPSQRRRASGGRTA